MARSINPEKQFHQKIIDWHSHHGRKNFPWQKNKTLYSVWLSEIMLQQTQVNTVIPYYEKFLKKFPTIDKLANAHTDEVMSLWSGLGYYARARNLHKTAQIIHEKFDNIFPNSLEEIMDLPGIGRSTAGAILSLTHNVPHAILDGNVKRVLSRYFCESQEKLLWAHAEKLIQPESAADYTQAMMDLGASVCTRNKPKCSLCPLENSCKAKLNHQIDLFPSKSKTKQKEDQTKLILIFIHNNKIFLERRKDSGIWGGLYSFPLIEKPEYFPKEIENLERETNISEIVIYPEKIHIFSHFRLYYTPIKINLREAEISFRYLSEKIIGGWYPYDEALQLGLPQPIREILLNSELISSLS
jgi:A/G-specific adenine glycosylase